MTSSNVPAVIVGSTYMRVPGCDAPAPPPMYYAVDEYGALTVICRCMICGRCGHHTGNTSQGHYWALCKALEKRLLRENPDKELTIDMCMREHHFCCPNDCELEESAS